MKPISSELMALKLACSICSVQDLRTYYAAAKKKKNQDRLDVILSVAKMRNIKLETEKK